jgi:sucrose phosphorylase
LEGELADENSLRTKVFRRFCQLLKARSSTSAFHPHGAQQIMDIQPAVFALERISPDGNSRLLCLHNVSAHQISVTTKQESVVDLFTGRSISLSTVSLQPYQVIWVKP